MHGCDVKMMHPSFGLDPLSAFTLRGLIRIYNLLCNDYHITYKTPIVLLSLDKY